HETEHEVWATGNQLLKAEAGIPGIDEMRERNGMGPGKAGREKRLHILRQIFPQAAARIVVDEAVQMDEPTPQPGDAQTPPRRARGSRRTQAKSLVVRALEASQDGQGQVPGSKLYQTMLRIDPSFSFKAQRFSTFTRFLESRNEVRVIRSQGPGDILVQLSSQRDAPPEQVKSSDSLEPSEPPVEKWERDVDFAWRSRQRQKIAGQSAAADVAKVLNAPNLKSTKYSTLDKLLEASHYLDFRWRREGNAIIRI
ncbi:MAG: hypothetical protein IIB17_03355, partial [Chloroflexi bacterium]|nr:hypothetical protein [Chloroflexota bacterium]